MGYSKWKKLFYILAIISMILSISSKVFAVTPTTFYNLPVYQDDPIQLKNDFNLIPVQFDSSQYSIYHFFCNGLASTNENDYKGYGLLCISSPDAVFSFKVDTLNSYNHIKITCDKPCSFLTLPQTEPQYMQNQYNNRINEFSTSTFPTLFANNWSGFTFYSPDTTQQVLDNNLSTMFAYSDNSTIKFYNSSNELINTVTPFHAPHFLNSTEIENSTNPDVIISRGSYSFNDYLYFHLLQINYTITENDSTIYYYSDKTFALNKDSKYYYTYENDTDNKHSYYSIPRSALGLDPNTSYLYVLTNSKKQINNSSGILEKDENSGIYDVIESDTANVITTQDSINDKIQNIDDTINDNTISNDTETNIEDSLNFNNQNQGLNNLNGGFFSRLTSMLSNLLGYNLAEDTSVNLPMPNSNKTITLHSKDIYDNVTGAIRLIINAFWVYIFSFYMWRFINKIYIAVSTGNILDNFSSSGEAITNNML